MQGDAQYERDGSPAADLAGLRVVVVEDHDEFQYFLAFVLRYFGAEVRGATSAEATGAI
jgi:CheY-like chemotaxis protein